MQECPCPKAVIFDMDGLMFDTEALMRNIWKSLAPIYGIKITDKTYSRFIGLRQQESDDLLRAIYGQDFPVRGFNEYANERYRNHLRHNGVPLKPGLKELLAMLKQRDCLTAVATSTCYDLTFHILNLAGLANHIGVVVSGDKVAKSKPAPDIFLETAHCLNVPPGECLVLEDSNAGVKGAVNAGMRVIMIPDLVDPSEEVASLPLRVLASLHDVIDLLNERLTKDNY